MSQNGTTAAYERYEIHTEEAPDLEPWPSRFKVKVGRVGLAKLLASEIIQYRGEMEVVFSRPCLYGVFSGPLGGFAPREQLCVGCLRCTTQYPEFVRVTPNPERRALGDSFFDFRYVDAVHYESSSGRIPVKGAGYRGKFGGEGWDGMWTDMSEIVRPTRDGIHGREFISTVVDIGARPAFLSFDGQGRPSGRLPSTFQLPLPTILDQPPRSAATDTVARILATAARDVGSLAVLPLRQVLALGLADGSVAPLVGPEDRNELGRLGYQPRLMEVTAWDPDLVGEVERRFPEAAVALRTPYRDAGQMLELADAGVRVFHLTADYHGRGADGRFVFDLIREAHNAFVAACRRDEVTLLGSGGIIAAEHVPKAIIAGLDAVALDTPLLVALQARFEGEFRDAESAACHLPKRLNVTWGNQRLKNLLAAWRDQLLEVLGAMGIREVRRLRGEMGRAMFQIDLEREAFAGIEGYPATER